MEDDDLNEKQTFLRENILEQGYDAEEFMKLLQDKKGESGLDLFLYIKKLYFNQFNIQ